MKKLCLLTLVAAMSILTGCVQRGGENTSSQTSSSQTSSGSTSSGTTSSGEASEATDTTIASLISKYNGKTSTKDKLWRITGTAQWPKDTYHGNFDIVDSSGYIYVYGCCKNKSCITKSGSTYTFTNKNDFNQAGIKPGDEVTLEGIFEWYSVSSSYKVAEFMGYVTNVVSKGQSNITGVSYTTPETYTGTYYDGISSSESGSTLLTSLHNLMDTTHTTFTSYNSLKNHYKSSDKYGSSGSNVKCFYSGNSYSYSSVNREHVWPQSLSNGLYGEDYCGADLQHVRPTNSTYNSKRGNAPFGIMFGDKTNVGKISYSGGGTDYYTGNVFEPADSIKGDVARIIMYVYMHYSTEVGGNSKSYYGNLVIHKVMGPYGNQAFQLLRKWNAEDPVSQDEITRNNYAYSIQGNRNPFIDHPTYADKIWG